MVVSGYVLDIDFRWSLSVAEWKPATGKMQVPALDREETKAVVKRREAVPSLARWFVVIRGVSQQTMSYFVPRSCIGEVSILVGVACFFDPQPIMQVLSDALIPGRTVSTYWATGACFLSLSTCFLRSAA